MKAAYLMAAIFASIPLFAQSAAPKPEMQKSDAQLQAESLMERARKLSDIRSSGAPAFRLKATFSFIGLDLNTAHGTYEEVWVSASQWWRETIVDNRRRIEVGGANRRWLLDNTTDFPDTAARLPDLMKVFPAINRQFDYESVAPDTAGGNTADCAITKAGSQGAKNAFCFEKKTGALLQKVSPEIRPKNAVNYSCIYGIFRKFGDFWFPREMACFEDKHSKLEAKVVDISLEPTPSADLFKPPPGAPEIGDCQGKSVPPTPVSTPAPNMGFFPGTTGATISLSAIVEKNGRLHELQIRKSGGKSLDEAALRAVSSWMFKPGTCDSEVLPTQIMIEVKLGQ